MQQQPLELPALRVAVAPPDGKSADVLVRQWDEAEQALMAQRLSKPVLRQPDPAQETTRVRYAYD